MSFIQEDDPPNFVALMVVVFIVILVGRALFGLLRP